MTAVNATRPTVLRELFPSSVITEEGTLEALQQEILPQELRCVERAVDKRRREFIAGRVAARCALARLGVRDFALLMGEDRRPRWPQGVVGSISHTEGYCGVAVARSTEVSAVGLDIERAESVTERLHRSLLLPSEARRVASHPQPARLATLHFSAKEAVYKCWSGVHAEFLEFHDVEIEVAADRESFTAHIQRRGEGREPIEASLQGRYAFHRDWVFTAVVLPAGRS